jgi:hypothetical protein
MRQNGPEAHLFADDDGTSPPFHGDIRGQRYHASCACIFKRILIVLTKCLTILRHYRAGWCMGGAAKLCSGRYSSRLSTGAPAILSERFGGFLQALQANSGTIRLGVDRFLPNDL